jgi:hypothetical protein
MKWVWERWVFNDAATGECFGMLELTVCSADHPDNRVHCVSARAGRGSFSRRVPPQCITQLER